MDRYEELYRRVARREVSAKDIDKLKSAIKTLPKQIDKIMYLRYEVGLTLSETGKTMGFSRQRTQQLEKQGYRLLVAKLGKGAKVDIDYLGLSNKSYLPLIRAGVTTIKQVEWYANRHELLKISGIGVTKEKEILEKLNKYKEAQ